MGLKKVIRLALLGSLLLQVLQYVVPSAAGLSFAEKIAADAQASELSSPLFTDSSSSTSISSSSAGEEVLEIAQFSHGVLEGWQERSFKGSTRYQLVEDSEHGTVLQAVSNASASVYGKRVQVDLTQTPYINWQWKIDNRLDGLDETTKSGDDFVARIYLVRTAGLFGRNSKAVNYVWSSNKQQGSQWHNAFKPKNSRMIAVRGAEHPTGRWVMEKRDVAADFLQLYGIGINQVDVVVIMSDTDNSGLSASASYGDIYFSRD